VPVAASTPRTVVSGKVFAMTPRLMSSVIRLPAGRPATVRAICGLLRKGFLRRPQVIF
jgi:hypothetical protein